MQRLCNTSNTIVIQLKHTADGVSKIHVPLDQVYYEYRIYYDSLTILNFITPFTYFFLKIDIIFKNNSYCQTHGIHTCHSVNLKVAERLKKILLKVGHPLNQWNIVNEMHIVLVQLICQLIVQFNDTRYSNNEQKCVYHVIL